MDKSDDTRTENGEARPSTGLKAAADDESAGDDSWLVRAGRIEPLEPSVSTEARIVARSAATLTAGSRLGRYTVARKLGQGGMGAVYEAHAQPGGERFALKTLLRVEADDILRCKREFRALQAIHHRNLVRLGELAVHDGVWFFTMEYIDGVDLISHLGSARVTMPDWAYHDTLASASGDGDAAPVERDNDASPVAAHPDGAGLYHRIRAAFAQIVDGLAAVHRAGKLHRDIKPHNIMVERTGRVVILDFGLILDVAPDDSLHASHSRGSLGAGTPAYMAPEQIRMGELQPATDFYSVGVVLFQALTGRLPFTGTTLEIMDARLTSPPRDPRDVSPDCPADLAVLCVDLMQRDPADRPDALAIRARLAAADAPALDVSPPQTVHDTRPNDAGSAPFVGRDEELARLIAGYQRVRQDASPLAITICGESGVGKSSLVRHFARALARDHALPTRPVVLMGRCYEREWMPYKAVDGIIDSLVRFLRTLSDQEAAAVTPRNAALLTRMFPVLAKLPSMAAAPTSSLADAQERRRRAFVALRELLHLLCERFPLLMVIDDMQWTDAESLDLLHELLRPPDGPPLLFITTERPSATPLAPWPCAEERIELGPLDQGDAHTLAAWLLDERGAAGERVTPEDLVREAGGHPLFLNELAHYLAHHQDGQPPEATDPDAHGPDAAVRLDAAIWTRVRQFDQATRTLLELVALAGAPVSHDVLARATGQPRDEIERRLRPLHLSRLTRGARSALTDTDTSAVLVQPYHDRVRESVRGHLANDQDERERERVRQHHATLATVLGEDPAVAPLLLLEHLRAAGRRKEASVQAERAARDADAALAYERAAEYYALALELDPERDSAELRRALALSLTRAGRLGDAADEYQILAASAEPDQALEYSITRARCLLSSWHVKRGRAELCAALDAVGGRYPRFQAMMIAEYLWRLTWLGWCRWPVHERPLEHMPAQELTALALDTAAFQGLFSYDPWRGTVFLLRGLWRARRLGHARSLGYLSAQGLILGISSGKTWEHRTLRGLRAQVEHYLAHTEDPEVEGIYRLITGPNVFMPMRWSAERLDRHFSELETLMGRSGEVSFSLGLVRIFWVAMLQHVGALATARRRAAAFVVDARRRRDHFSELAYRGALANTHLLEDRPDIWREEVWDVHEERVRRGVDGLAVGTWTALVTIDLYEGEAHDLRAIEASMARSWRMFKLAAWWRPQLLWLEARIALLRALQDPTHTPMRRALRIARRSIRALERETSDESHVFAALLRARIAWLEERTETAITALEVAVEHAEVCQLQLYANGAKLRLGEIVGEERGRTLIAQAHAWMEREGVRNPSRLANLSLDAL